MDVRGSLLRTTYNKPAWTDDFTVNKLGYNTDNGAYYYYNTEPNKNYEDTLIDVYRYAVNNSIPYGWFLLDSWWYYRGKLNGVKNWTARPDVFPNGMQYLHDQTNYPFIAHN